jgi:hypothetical protein
VKAVALAHIAGLKGKIAELQAMTETLEHLAKNCRGNARPDCPIIEDLAERTSAAERPSRRHGRTSRFGVDTPASTRDRITAVRRS